MSNSLATAIQSGVDKNRPKLKFYTRHDLREIPQLAMLGEDVIKEIDTVAKVFPFRVNSYVLEHLIDWSHVPNDPMFRVVFPSRSMLDEESFGTLARAAGTGSDREQDVLAQTIRAKLNPHPADQLTLNRPFFGGEQLNGLQHKYPQTVLFFPSDAQTCHSYCTFCFRWPQFGPGSPVRMAMNDRELLTNYLRDHTEVSDLLITGGDAFFMKASRLRYFLEPLVRSDLRHVANIRFGTKVLSFWPHRFVTDKDSDALIELISWLRSHGKSVSIMAHFNHWRELTTPILEEAVAHLQTAGAVIRTQSPLLKGINDSAAVWSRLWRRQVELGMVPYYMFVLRDTGPKQFFEVPLIKAWEIYTQASLQLSGLAKTVRGPVMSTGPGKIELTGVADVEGQSVFVFRFIQARDPRWVNRPFFGTFKDDATWIDNVSPAFGAAEFFFSEDYRRMQDPIGALS